MPQNRTARKGRRHLLFSLLGILLILVLVDCAGLKTHREMEQEQIDQKQRERAPPTPQGDSQAGPSPLRIPEAKVKALKMPKVGLILGPGGLKSFAHTGVIRELHKAKIPIASIIGLEWGALVAALYSQKGQIHEAEWKLYKLEQKDFLAKGLFSSGFQPESVKKLESFFKSNFNNGTVEQAKIRFACPSLSLWSGTIVWQKKGALDKAVEKCLPYPPLFKATNSWMAGAFALEESVRLLQDTGIDLVIFVNVLDQGAVLNQDDLIEKYPSAILWYELRRYLSAEQKKAAEVIQVTTRPFSLYDFENRKKLVLAGEQAGRLAAQRIAEKYGF